MIVRTLLLLAFMAITCETFAQNNPHPGHLYKISKPGLTKPAYLFAYIPSYYSNVLRVGQRVYQLIDSAAVVYMERSPYDNFVANTSNKNAANAYLRKPILPLLNAADKAVYTKLAADKTTSLSTSQEASRSTLELLSSPEKGLPQHWWIYRIAGMGGKQVNSLNIWQENQADVALMLPSVQLYDEQRYTQESDTSYAELNTELAELYLSGNLESLLKKYEAEGAISPAHNRLNALYASRMDTALQSQGGFFAIHATRLPGNEGLLALLARKGYTITPVDAGKQSSMEAYTIPEKSPLLFPYSNAENMVKVKAWAKPIQASSESLGNASMMVDLNRGIIQIMTSSPLLQDELPSDSLLEKRLRQQLAGYSDQMNIEPFVEDGVKGLQYKLEMNGLYMQMRMARFDDMVGVNMLMKAQKDIEIPKHIIESYNSFTLLASGNAAEGSTSLQMLNPQVKGEVPVRLSTPEINEENDPAKDSLSTEGKSRVYNGRSYTQKMRINYEYLLVGRSQYLMGEQKVIAAYTKDFSNNKAYSTTLAVNRDAGLTTFSGKSIPKKSGSGILFKGFIYGNHCHFLSIYLPLSDLNAGKGQSIIDDFQYVRPAKPGPHRLQKTDHFEAMAPQAFVLLPEPVVEETDTIAVNDELEGENTMEAPAKQATTNTPARNWRYDAKEPETNYHYNVVTVDADSLGWFASAQAMLDSGLAFSKKTLEADTVYGVYKTVENGVPVLYAVIPVEDSIRVSFVKILLYNKQYVVASTGQSVYDTANGNARRFLQSVKLANPPREQTLATDRATWFLHSLQSAQAATHTQFANAIEAAPFTTKDIPAIRKAMLRHYANTDESEEISMVHQQLYYKLNGLDDTTVGNLLQAQVPVATQFSSFEMSSLWAILISEKPTAANVQKAVIWLQKTAPDAKIAEAFYNELSENISLLKPQAKTLVGLLQRKENRHQITWLLRQLADSAMLTPAMLLPAEKMLIDEYNHQKKLYEKNAENYRNYNLFSALRLIAFLKTPAANKLLASLEQSDNLFYVFKAMQIAALGSKRFTPAAVQRLSDAALYRMGMYEMLKKEGMLSLMPSKHKNQLAMAQTAMHTYLDENYYVDSVQYLSTEEIETDDDKQRVYLFSVQYRSQRYGDPMVHIAAARYSLNKNELEPLEDGMHLNRYTELTNENLAAQKKYLLAQIKQALKKENERGEEEEEEME